MPSFEDEIDAGIARALETSRPALYRAVAALVEAGQTRKQIMSHVTRITRLTRAELTASTIETTVAYLIRQKRAKR